MAIPLSWSYGSEWKNRNFQIDWGLRESLAVEKGEHSGGHEQGGEAAKANGDVTALFMCPKANSSSHELMQVDGLKRLRIKKQMAERYSDLMSN
ncbi:hypothetical protein FDENT_4516 [Fusarium denticulatum]|uniref:Uncharacterized protein n=1 Tax=Fusarium denticulatum TaxID=48507 RepID=A0A8H5UN84_9HYPO|nr:hypothetical protein FDENT_4516 [Fusarium denticulatum]